MLAWFEAGGAGLDQRFRKPLQQAIPFRFGKALERIATTSSTASGKVRPWEVGSTSGQFEATIGSTEGGYDFVGTGASSGEKVLLFRHQQSGRLFLQALPGRRCGGQMKGALSSTNTYQDVDNVAPLWGASPTTALAVALQVYNPLKLTSTDNAICRFEWNKNSQHWELYAVEGGGAVQGTTWKVVVDYQVDAANKKLQKKIAGHKAVLTSSSTGWIDVHTGTTCT